MKSFILALLVAVVAIVAIPEKQAHAVAGTAIRLKYDANQLSQLAYVPLISTTTRAIKGITVLNTGNQPVWIGVAGSGAAVGSETSIFIVNAFMSVFTFVPATISGGSRISVIGAGHEDFGELQFNALY